MKLAAYLYLCIRMMTAENCTVCDNYNDTGVVSPLSIPCSEIRMYENCSYELAVQYCECSFDCFLCGSEQDNAMVNDSKPLPELDVLAGFTCGFVMSIKQQNSSSCDSIRQRYAYHCGCSNAVPCEFCPNGGSPNVVDRTIPINVVPQTTCWSFQELHHVTPENECEAAKAELRNVAFAPLYYDVYNYCECPGYEDAPEGICGPFCDVDSFIPYYC